MLNITILDAPTDLGLMPTGVDGLGAALQAAGLRQRLNAEYAGRIEPIRYDARRDDETHLLNPDGLRDFALGQAEAVGAILDRSRFPLVLGGDDSVLFGNLLALRRRGRFGLVFLDAHTDFYLPEQSTTGQASDCDLALATGRGPAIIANLDGLKPLVRDEDVAAIGSRDADERAELDSPDLRTTDALVLDLDEIRQLDPHYVAGIVLQHILTDDVEGFWIHLDTDIIDDATNPAVDYRVPDGLRIQELGELLRSLMASDKAVGMDVTIYNPSLDPDGDAAREIVRALQAGLRSS